MAMTNVSCQGDKRFTTALNLLAQKHETTIGALVRRALDEKYGEEIEALEPIIASFFDSVDAHVQQSKRSSNGGVNNGN